MIERKLTTAEEAKLPSLEQNLTEYRRLVAVAQEAMQNLDGSEETYIGLWRALIALDGYYYPLEPKSETLRDLFEFQYAQQVGIDNPREATVSNLLMEASTRYQRILGGNASTLSESIGCLEELGILVKHSKLVLVETNPETAILRTGNGAFEAARYSPRLQILIAGLQTIGVFKDDLIITIGALRENMMRKHPYVLVEIPKLGREVLVCNENGQVTFVSDRLRGINAYSNVDKEALKETVGLFAVRYSTEENWLSEIAVLLTKD